LVKRDALIKGSDPYWFMIIKKEIRIDKDDRCGSVHPVYSVIEELGELRSGEAIMVTVNDEDWVRTLKSVAELRRVNIIDAGQERGYWRFIITRFSDEQKAS